MKLAESLASTGANVAWVVQDSDPFGKDGGFASLFTDKILESDPGLKELVDLYYKIVEIYQKYAVPISIRIIENMIQKNKVIENKEKKETENLGDKGVKYFMIDAQSSKYLKHFPDCCKQVSAMFMHSFKNGNADMKTILSYHFSAQNNGRDGKADGLMTLGLFHRALFVLVSLLSIFHSQDFKDIFEKGEFNLKRLLKKAAGVTGVKESKCALVSKSTDIFCRLVGSNTIESCSLESFVREKGISYEDFLSPFANQFTYKRNVQELRGYDVSLDRSSLTQYNTFRGVSEMKSGKFKCRHPSALIAAYVHDQALILSGIRDVTLNFESQEDFEEKFEAAIDTELIKKQETMSKEDWAKFNQESYIAKCKESIPSDAVIKGVIEYDLTWKESVERKGVLEYVDKEDKLWTVTIKNNVERSDQGKESEAKRVCTFCWEEESYLYHGHRSFWGY